MRRLHLVMVCLAFMTVGCERSQPLAPTTLPTPGPVPPVRPVLPPPFEQRLEIDEVIKTRITADDGWCGDQFPYHCRHYGLTAKTSGVLQVTMTWWGGGEYPLDLGVIDSLGREWPALAGPGRRRDVVLPVVAGETYVIEIWSFLFPGEEFELRSAFEAR